ncbi:ferritin-like domain-containing protein [Arthrobacter sp. RHLT1-20]
MKDDTGEKRGRELLPRFALLSILALVVVSLGVALTPGGPKEPAAPPYSEQARAAALSDTMRLRAAGEQLARSAAGAGQASVSLTVSLLTSQARALLLPGEPVSDAAVSPSAPPASSAAALPSSSAAAPPLSAAALAGALASSGSQRLADAAVADSGMARLLASVGTAQLLQASSLAAATGAPDPPQADPAGPKPSGACPGQPATASTSGPSDGAAILREALAATVRSELETVYGYQVALTRLGGGAATSASEQLARHEALAGEAEALSRMHCAPVPSRQAGYTMSPDFLASPAAGLGSLEASALPVYGDLVALSEGQTRQWAIAGLVGAARRSALWGAETGALPGLGMDPEGFPELPTPSP